MRNTLAFEHVFSQKFHILFFSLGMILGGYLIGFIKGWLYAVFILCVSPLMVLGMLLFMYYEV